MPIDIERSPKKRKSYDVVHVLSQCCRLLSEMRKSFYRAQPYEEHTVIYYTLNEFNRITCSEIVIWTMMEIQWAASSLLDHLKWKWSPSIMAQTLSPSFLFFICFVSAPFPTMGRSTMKKIALGIVFLAYDIIFGNTSSTKADKSKWLNFFTCYCFFLFFLTFLVIVVWIVLINWRQYQYVWEPNPLNHFQGKQF